LRASGLIVNDKVPMLGLNTDPSRSSGFLCNAKIYNDMKEKNIERIFHNLEKENFEYFYRTRVNFHTHQDDKVINKLALNEVFCAEKDVANISIYELDVDGENLGRFKSSGLIISTGTGSSGWLQSARRISYIDVRTILNHLGNHDNLELVITLLYLEQY